MMTFQLSYTLPQYILFFFIYGVIGWCLEVAFAAVKTNSLVNRGFLNGPICPIYGVGMLSLILCLEPLADNLVYTFIGGTVLATLIELIGGWVLFHIFHTRWWDYSHLKWNLGGYICPQFCLAWGAGSLVMMEIIHPAIAVPVTHIPFLPLVIIDAVLLVTIGVDIGVSAAEAAGLNKHLREMDSLSAGLRSVSDRLTEIIGTNTMTADELLDRQKLQMTLAAMEGRENAAELKEQLLALANRSRRLQAEGKRYQGQRFMGTGRLLRAFPNMQSAHHAEALASTRDKMAAGAADFAKLLAATARKVKTTAEAAADKVKGTAEEAADKISEAKTKADKR